MPRHTHTNSTHSSSSPYPVHVYSRDHYNRLDQQLDAYSVLPTKPPQNYNLFQVVFISTRFENRRHSPAHTLANLEQIFHAIRNNSHNYGYDAEYIRPQIHKFEQHFSTITKQARGQPLQEVQEGGRGTDRSRWNVALGATEFASFSLNVSEGRDEAFRWKIRVKQWSAYTGNGLKGLIMENAGPLFSILMKELGNTFRMRDEKRMLIGVVVMNQIVDIEVERMVKKGRRNGGGLKIHDILRLGGNLESEFDFVYDRAERNRLGGVHMIVFRVKRMARYGYRFYEGVDVTTSNHGEWSAGSQTMEDLKRWQKGGNSEQRGRKADLDYPTSGHGTGGWEGESEVKDVETTESCSDGGSERSWDEASDEDDVAEGTRFVDIEGEEETWVDIDWSESLEEFMLDQCVLANGYVRNEERDVELQKHGVGILRSVLVNASLRCEKPTLQAMRLLGYCYQKGWGMEKNEEFGRGLEKCGDYLETNGGRLAWESIEEEFEIMSREKEPEKRLVQICLLHWSKEEEMKERQLARGMIMMYWSLWSKEVRPGYLGMMKNKYLPSLVEEEEQGEKWLLQPYETITPSAPTLFVADRERKTHGFGGGCGRRMKHPNTGVVQLAESYMRVPDFAEELNVMPQSIDESGPFSYVSNANGNETDVHVH